MPTPSRLRRFAAALAVTVATTAAAPSHGGAQLARPSVPACLVGTYDGGQPEVAAGLQLRADGRFRYTLSYGALDEEAEGIWTLAGHAVLLTSDPFTPPRFVLLDQRAAPAGQLAIGLELPEGMSRQYVHAEIRLAGGRAIDRQLSEEDEPLEIAPGQRPESVALVLPVFDLRSPSVPLAGTGGHRLRYRFEPDGLGKVAFARTPLRVDGGTLLLDRHDRTIRFRRVGKPQDEGGSPGGRRMPAATARGPG